MHLFEVEREHAALTLIVNLSRRETAEEALLFRATIRESILRQATKACQSLVGQSWHESRFL